MSRPSVGGAATLARRVAVALRVVETDGEGVPRQRRALDPRRELDHAAEGLEIAELDLDTVVVGLARRAIEFVLVDRHHSLEGPRDRARFVDALALDRNAHHRGRCLADGATLPGDAHVIDAPVVDVDVDRDLVATQWVESLCAMRGRTLE